jgi:hypothetical protein
MSEMAPSPLRRVVMEGRRFETTGGKSDHLVARLFERQSGHERGTAASC